MELHAVKSKTKLTNGDQYNRLVEFMVENPTVASYITVRSAQDRITYNISWEDLSAQLNMRGPPMRTMEEWKKVWKDYKYHIKKKCYLKQRNEKSRAAGDTANYKKINFSANELAIIKILNLNTVLPRRKKKDDNELLPKRTLLPPPPPLTKCTNSTSKPEMFGPPVIKTELSEMIFEITNVTSGIEFIDATSESLPATSKNTTTTGIPNTVSEMQQEISLLEKQLEIDKRHLELKEKMYHLKERKFEMKCQQMKDDFNYKTQKLELKKRELELKEITQLRKQNKIKRQN